MKLPVKLIIFVFLFCITKHFCSTQTNGFTISHIISQIPYKKTWEFSSPTQSDKKEVEYAFRQEFIYKGKGAQCYVFESKDGLYILKFFKYQHLLFPKFLITLPLPAFLDQYRQQKVALRKKKLFHLFSSLKIAYEELKEETALLDLHLNKTTHLKQKITIVDNLKISHSLSLDQMEFILQRKAVLLYPKIEELMHKEDIIAAKDALSSLILLISNRMRKGIFDKDPNLTKNFGFIGNRAVQIDIGGFSKIPTLDRLEACGEDVQHWIDSKYPSLSTHFQSEFQKLIELNNSSYLCNKEMK